MDVRVGALVEELAAVAQLEGAGVEQLIALATRQHGGGRCTVPGAGVAGLAVVGGALAVDHAAGAVAVGVEQRVADAIGIQVARAGRGPAIEATTCLVTVVAILGLAALVLVEPVALVALEAEEQVEAVLIQAADATEHIGVVLLGAALAGETGAATGFQALVVLAGDQVDDPGNGVGAVDRRGAVLEYFDAIQRFDRQCIDVDEGVGQLAFRKDVVGHPPPIEQDQGIAQAQAAQRDAIGARRPARVAVAVEGVAGIRRDRAEHLGHRGLAHPRQGFGVQHLYRVGALAIGAANVRAGHHDPVEHGRAGLLQRGASDHVATAGGWLGLQVGALEQQYEGLLDAEIALERGGFLAGGEIAWGDDIAAGLARQFVERLAQRQGRQFDMAQRLLGLGRVAGSGGPGQSQGQGQRAPGALARVLRGWHAVTPLSVSGLCWPMQLTSNEGGITAPAIAPGNNIFFSYAYFAQFNAGRYARFRHRRCSPVPRKCWAAAPVCGRVRCWRTSRSGAVPRPSDRPAGWARGDSVEAPPAPR
ncbi:MAG: hypothetical protein GAK45_01977 [Pseudomonas citronellolis]|nr:MAG: hypothetical protein GAK45_01977 [Pseudomonas citronellolis]